MSTTDKAVPVGILAAGEGSRLWQGGFELPKPCVSLLGTSIAEWSVRAFRAAGIEQFLVALGCNGDAIRTHYEELVQRLGGDVSFVEVADWHLGNGRSSLAIAESFGDRPFLLSMADHVFSPSLVREVLGQAPGEGRMALAVDRNADDVLDLDDLTKVVTEGRRIVKIGKELLEWNAGDTGLFFGNPVLAEGLRIAQSQDLNSLTDGVRECAARGQAFVIELGSEHEWVDIDTRADLLALEKSGIDWLGGAELRAVANQR